jgi:3-oxoadipate enol-lactonase
MARVRVGALDLHYEVDGAGEPVLLLMGLGGELHAWDLVRPALVRSHRVVLLDNRDAGESDEAEGGYATADMAADALGLMDHLGVERFHVVGASMGGAIAQHLTLAAPARVASLVLASTWGRTDAFLRAILALWGDLVGRLPAASFLAAQSPWAFTYRFLERPSPAVTALQARFAERGPLRSVAAYRRQVDACLAHDALALLPILRTPTLVLVGEEDLLTPPRHARALAAALGNAEMAVLPATGHACFLETPEPVARRVLSFLARRAIR